VNEGVAGDRILHGDVGPNALSRFDRDILTTSGVRFIPVLLGITDIGLGGSTPTEAVSADDIIGGYRQLIPAPIATILAPHTSVQRMRLSVS
jgi:hypothetical protein